MKLYAVLVGLFVLGAAINTGKAVELCKICEDVMDLLLKRIVGSVPVNEAEIQSLLTIVCTETGTSDCITKLLPLVPEIVKLINDGTRDPKILCCKLGLCQANSTDCKNTTLV